MVQFWCIIIYGLNYAILGFTNIIFRFCYLMVVGFKSVTLEAFHIKVTS